MKVAIIGAGGAGLISAKYAIEQNINCEVFEQSNQVGGTWNYTDLVENDENGFPLNTAMYKNLRTNLPKETMAYLDFPYPQQKKSYVYQPEVIAYLNSFANTFKLHKVIKFCKQVVLVSKTTDEKWSVKVKDAKTKQEETKEFDAVMICNGHYSKPNIPRIYGIKKFKGKILHSKNYRKPEDFKDKTVLVIGSGPSGIDIFRQIATTAKKVIMSHRHRFFQNPEEAILKKGEVSQVLENSVHFIGDRETIPVDVILFCTGYVYSFPFLDQTSHITVENNHVKPLYKHVINIEHPKMAFIGLPFQICPFPLFDVQARFFLATLKNPSLLPSKTDMKKSLREDEDRQRTRGLGQDDFHLIGEFQEEYFDDIADIAKIRRIPSVVSSLYLRVRQNRNLEDCFVIVDDHSWIQVI